MPDVYIIVEAPGDAGTSPETSAADLDPIAVQQIRALQQAIGASAPTYSVHTIAPSVLTQPEFTPPQDSIWCPLTLNLPDSLSFPGQAVYRHCRPEALIELRRQVEQWGYPTGEGHYWLPIAWTAKGPLYGEAIGLKPKAKHSLSGGMGSVVLPRDPEDYVQPWHLSDPQRQPLYRLGFRLLKQWQASPSIYLMQFGYDDQTLWFDRIWPFPADPAIASIGVQEPDLLTAYWACLTGQPLLDLVIVPHPRQPFDSLDPIDTQ